MHSPAVAIPVAHLAGQAGGAGYNIQSMPSK
jgi:hypothetical protein